MRAIPAILALVLSLACTVVLVLWARGYRSPGARALRTEGMQDHVARVVPYIGLRDVPFREGVWFVQDAGFALGAGKDIDLNENGLRAAGVSLEAPLTLEERNIPLGMAFVRLASVPGVTCRADADLIHISSNADVRPLNDFERPESVRFPADPRVRDSLHRLENADVATVGRKSKPAKRRGSVSLSQTTFAHAIQKLQEASGLTFVLDEGALRAAGIDDDTPVSVTSRNTMAANLLAMVLRNAAPLHPLQFRPEGAVVRISTRKQFDLEDRPRRLQAGCVALAVVIATGVLAYAARRRLRRLAASLKGRATTAAVPICVAGAAILVASLAKPIELVAFSRSLTLDSARGELHVWLSPADPLLPYRDRDASIRARSLAPLSQVPVIRATPIRGLEVLHRAWPCQTWLVRTRCAAAAAVTGLFPLLWIGWRGRAAITLRRRKRAGLCLACGYDLRESRGVCPECGAVEIP